MSSKTGRQITARSGRVPSEAVLIDALSRAANEMAREVFQATQPDVPAPPVMQLGRAPYRRFSWIPAPVMVAGVVLGALMAAQASTVHWQLTGSLDTRFTDEETNAAVQRGSLGQTLAGVGFGVAAACLVASGLLFFWREEPMALQAMVGPAGGGLQVAGSW